MAGMRAGIGLLSIGIKAGTSVAKSPPVRPASRPRETAKHSAADPAEDSKTGIAVATTEKTAEVAAILRFDRLAAKLFPFLAEISHVFSCHKLVCNGAVEVKNQRPV